MKNRILLFGVVVIIMSFIVTFGYTNAKYRSDMSMSGDIDYVKVIGEIESFNPQWEQFYEGPDDGSGVFNFPNYPGDLFNIHYKVKNKIGEQLNSEPIEYYIRVVPEGCDGNMEVVGYKDNFIKDAAGQDTAKTNGTNVETSTMMISEWNVHEYSVGGNVIPGNEKVYPLKKDIGYGPFTLGTEEEEKIYSIRAKLAFDYNKHPEYIDNVQKIKVQMIRLRPDGRIKVLDEAPLNLKYTGDRWKAYISYHRFEGENLPSTSLGTIYNQTLNIPVTYSAYTINFKDENQLREIGFKIPDGYEVHDARCSLWNWEAKTVATISPGLELVGINIEIHLEYKATTTVNLKFYNEYRYSSYLIDSQTISGIRLNTLIDFKNANGLNELGISMPLIYKFREAYSKDIDGSGTDPKTQFRIPTDNKKSVYNIDVVCEATKIPIKVYDNDELLTDEDSLTLQPDGTCILDLQQCNALHDSLAGKNSYSIYIFDKWGSSMEIGSVNANTSVTLEYGKTYEADWGGKFNLRDEETYVMIKCWW